MICNFSARPAASITSAELATYAAEVKNASAAISRALEEGFPAPGGGRFRPDHAFMASLSKLARFAEEKLENVRKTVGEARLRDFANRPPTPSSASTANPRFPPKAK